MPAVRKQAEATMTHCCGALAQRCRLAPWSLRSRRRWSLPSMWRGDPRLPARRPAARRSGCVPCLVWRHRRGGRHFSCCRHLASVGVGVDSLWV